MKLKEITSALFRFLLTEVFQCGFDAGDCGFEYFYKEMWGIDATTLTPNERFVIPSDKPVHPFFSDMNTQKKTDTFFGFVVFLCEFIWSCWLR